MLSSRAHPNRKNRKFPRPAAVSDRTLAKCSPVVSERQPLPIHKSTFVIRQSVRRSLGEVGSSLLKKPHHRSLSHALSPAPSQLRNPKVQQGKADSDPPCLWNMPLGLFDRALRMRLLTFSFSESQLFSFFPHPPSPAESDYDPIIVAPHEGPEMVVVGEWVSSID